MSPLPLGQLTLAQNKPVRIHNKQKRQTTYCIFNFSMLHWRGHWGGHPGSWSQILAMARATQSPPGGDFHLSWRPRTILRQSGKFPATHDRHIIPIDSVSALRFVAIGTRASTCPVYGPSSSLTTTHWLGNGSTTTRAGNALSTTCAPNTACTESASTSKDLTSGPCTASTIYSNSWRSSRGALSR